MLHILIYIYMIEFSVLVSILILIWIARVVEIQSMKLYYHPATTKRWELLNCPTFLHKIVFQCLRLLGWTLRCIQFVSGNFSIFALLSSRLHPGKTNMTIQNKPFQDVSPMKNGDFPAIAMSIYHRNLGSNRHGCFLSTKVASLKSPPLQGAGRSIPNLHDNRNSWRHGDTPRG